MEPCTKLTPMAEQIRVTRAQNGGCFLPSTSRRSSGVLWILLPSQTRFMANSSKAAMMKPTVGEIMRESMMSMALPTLMPSVRG
ncbi:hypothetical protein D3C80_2109990 [compost metagenome]